MNPLVVIIPLTALAVAFAVYCLADLARAEEVRYLPRWAWAILCLGIGLTIPWGGILYLAIGRVRPPKPPRGHRVRGVWPMWKSPGDAAASG